MTSLSISAFIIPIVKQFVNNNFRVYLYFVILYTTLHIFQISLHMEKWFTI